MELLFTVRQQTLTHIDTRVEPRVGSSNYLTLKFIFTSPDWKSLRKTVHLSSGDVSTPYIIEGDTLDVPAYFTQQSSFDVTLLGDSGEVIVPTNVVTMELDESNTLWTSTPPDPQNSAYLELLKSVGNINDLATEDKTNLVAAINEIFATKGGVIDHSKLTGRNAPDQHTIEAVTGLAQALADKLDAAELPEAINTALAQAKASGKFKGDSGTPGKDGKDGATGKSVVYGKLIDPSAASDSHAVVSGLIANRTRITVAVSNVKDFKLGDIAVLKGRYNDEPRVSYMLYCDVHEIAGSNLRVYPFQVIEDGAPGRDGQPGKNGQDGAPGKDGPQGANGQNGGYYTPDVQESAPETVEFSFTGSNPEMAPVGPFTVQIPSGGDSVVVVHEKNSKADKDIFEVNAALRDGKRVILIRNNGEQFDAYKADGGGIVNFYHIDNSGGVTVIQKAELKAMNDVAFATEPIRTPAKQVTATVPPGLTAEGNVQSVLDALAARPNGIYPTWPMTEATAVLNPNVFYIWGEIAALSVTFAPAIEGKASEYTFEFKSGNSPTNLTLPGDVKWVTPLKVEANKTYQVSVLNGIGVIGGA